MHVGVVQADTPLQALLVSLRQMPSSTMGASTGRWTARRRLIQATNVKTTISVCPRAGRWQPTMPIQYTSSDRTPGEHHTWLLQMDVHTILPIIQVVPGIRTPLQPCIVRLGHSTMSVSAIL
jgi:hypothetical protein